MSLLYFIRHGQAGTRQEYDALSELGSTQSTLVGEHLATQGLPFRAVYSGLLRRQLQTAELARTACLGAGGELTEITPDPVWNEFDLAAVYEAMAPRLAADNPEFRRAYEEMQKAIAANEAGIDRRWFPTDLAIVRAWIEGRYHFDGESWPDFKKRIAGGVQALRDSGREEPVAVFTSATPMAIATSLALGVSDDRTILKLAGACYNTSLTVLKTNPADLMLVQFNSIPHLSDPALRSFR